VNKTVQKLTWVAWGTFVAIRGLLLVASRLPGWTEIMLWGISLAALFWLLGVYNRWVARWRVVVSFWAAYAGLHWLITQLALASAPILAHNLTNLVAVLIMDTMIAGYAGLVILAIRRDVSVMYVVLATFMGGIALRSQVQAAGGVLNWLLAAATTSMQEEFRAIEPLMMMGSCMITLGIITFLPHLFWLHYLCTFLN